ncbi:hypothetical protein JCM5350_001218 [Sporobolomyces pararoseus]
MHIGTLKLFSFSRPSTDYQPSNRPNPSLPPLTPPSHRPTSAHEDLSNSTNREKGESTGTGHLFLMGHSPSPPSKLHRITRSRSPKDQTTRIRPRSLSRRRYELPKVPQEGVEPCPYCPGREGKARNLDQETARSTGLSRTEGAEEIRRGSASSLELQGLNGNSRRRISTNRPPLFDDVDELDGLSLSSTSSSASSSEEEDDLDGEEESLFSYNSPPTSAYSLGRTPSLRKSSLSTTATSDPLISPSSIPSLPVLSYGCPAHQRGHWLPATPDKIPAPSAESQTAPSLPDAPSSPQSALPLSSSPEKQQSSLRRASSLTSFSPSRPSLLSKSLRSLASLPNLTLPNLLPQLPRPDIYLTSGGFDSAQPPFLKSGWGARERRRVLESEPSWDADEARGLLSRRSRRLPSLIDEVEATLFATTSGIGSVDADLALSDFSTPVPLPSPPPSPTAEAPSPNQTLSTTPLPPPGPPPPPPSQRFISNTRHLLMLSIEFSMMRADKISSPLRPRAVIVRNGSPTRGGTSSLGPSSLRNEVL